MAYAPALLRFATRYTRSLHDAEDVYQRAMEIALVRAPVTEPAPFMAWLHTVIKHEALAVLRAHRREATGAEADVASVHAETVADEIGLEASYEWRERYRALQDALRGLTEPQRICIMLQSAGASYAHTAIVTGWSRRKVERSILEGRRQLHAWEVQLATGEVCERLLPALERLAAEESPAEERRMLERHVRHCMACRTLLRIRCESRDWLGALVPIGLLGGDVLVATPDPTPYLPYWERITSGATVRMGQLLQVAMELPGTALGRIGAGTAAVALAATAGVPLVVDAVQGPDPEPPLVAEAASGAPRTAPKARQTPAVPAPAEAVSTRAEMGDRPASEPARARGGTEPVRRAGTPAEGRSPQRKAASQEAATGRAPRAEAAAPPRRQRATQSAGTAPRDSATPVDPAPAAPAPVAPAPVAPAAVAPAPVAPAPPPVVVSSPPPPPPPATPSRAELVATFGP